MRPDGSKRPEVERTDSTDFFKGHTEITEITDIFSGSHEFEPVGCAVLYGECADNGGDDGADDLQHLEYFLPIDFHFTQIKLFKKVTQNQRSTAEGKVKSRKSQKLCNFASKILYAMTDNERTYEIRGAIYDVYKTLGPGLLESVYEEALVFELEQRGLKVERQRQHP